MAKREKSNIKYEVFIARLLLILGGLSLGILGAIDKNPIQEFLVNLPTVKNVIYCLIGFAALYELWDLFGRK